ncbi:heterokaryon incompatibility protein-domain-containing protein [Ustulina deusta]|nr:heterokaryon incompatibility protein-domain-containing protein [Ustulina deusta]
MLPSTDSASCKPTLCTRCHDLRLTAADFFVDERETKETRNPENVYDPITKDTRAWKDVEEAKDCPLCQIIKCAVENSRAGSLSSNAPHSCELKLTRLHGSQNVRHIQNDVRCLEVLAKYDWNTSRGIELLPVESDEYPGCFPGRLIDPQGIDVGRVRSWLGQCQNYHGDICRHLKSPQFQKIRPHVLVFDVKEQCLVQLQLFMVPKGLLPIRNQLPRVILDAARLTEELGERYLWVDALCIIQDDAAFKDLLISSMHTIYENALLTVFAAAGADSNAGLPGLRPTPRGCSQLVAEVADGLKLVFPISYENIKQSKWASRGWTYQEYFFARRRLIFVNGQIVYRCSKMRWREDTAQEHLARGIIHFQVDRAGSRTNWEPPDVQYSNAPRDKWSRYHFNTYVETYLDRDLTFDGDILSAFAGITNEAEHKQLPISWGLTEKHIGIDLLWLPCKWLTRRPGFPSWSWAGWKGPVICYQERAAGPEIWQHRKSWIDWYIFSQDSNKFRLLSTGYAPLREAEIADMEDSDRRFNERMKEFERERAGEESPARDQDNDSGNTLDAGIFSSLLWTLGHSERMVALPEREPHPLHCTPAIDDQTLLFRTLTACISISSLNPDGHPSLPPLDDQLVLPSAPTLHLYAADGIHIGSAWPHTQELFDRVSSYDRDILAYDPSASRLQIEIALLAGPLKGDWRSRSERVTTYEYMLELLHAGLGFDSAAARYEQKMLYEKEIARIYVDMVSERQTAEGGAAGVENRLTVGFWEDLEERVSLENLESKFPGHCEETVRPVIDRLTSVGAGMRAKEGQEFIKLMLIGDPGDGVTDDAGGTIKERTGMGEIRNDVLGLIQGLAFRDIMLK